MNSVTGPAQAKLSYPTFAAILWTCIAITFGFVVFRLGIRIRAFKKMFWDDALVSFAWFSFLAGAIVWQLGHNGIYVQFVLNSGAVAPTEEAIATFLYGERLQLGVHLTYLICLWGVKLSFLIFFRRLGNKVRGQKIWWWTVTGILVVTFLTCVGLLPYPCLVGDASYIFSHCNTYTDIRSNSIRLYTILAIDVMTDLLVVSIPVSILWNVRIPLRQKLGLVGIFSLTIIVIVFAIVRTAVVNTNNHELWDVTWLHFWTFMEMSVALIVSCVASFRQLFIYSERSLLPTSTKWTVASTTSSIPSSPGGESITFQSKEQGRPLPRESKDGSVPFKSVQVIRVDTSNIVKQRGGGYGRAVERPKSWTFLTTLGMGFMGQRI